jgi:putative Mg2+ transporter-C (MgtC) family protein
MSNIANHIDILDFILRLSLAISCGFLIGLERQWINRVAGIQTNVLVCSGACLYVLSSFFMSYEGQSASRITAQIVSGIGFLGAGMIFKDGFNAHGINTAATIWACAAIGILCGMGLIPYAILSVLFLILANTCFRQIDHAISKNRRWADLRRRNRYIINVAFPKDNVKQIRSSVLKEISIKDHVIHSVHTEFIRDVARVRVGFTTQFLNYDNIQEVCENIEKINSEIIVDWSQNSTKETE